MIHASRSSALPTFRGVGVRSLCLILGAGVGCRDDGLDPARELVSLHVVAGTPTSGTVDYAIVVGVSSMLTAQGTARDSTLLGGPVVAAWSSSDTTVLSVRDTTFGTGASAIPGARILARRSGRVTVTAIATAGGRVIQGQLSVPVATPLARF